MEAEALWALGQREFEDGEYGDATETLERLQSVFPSFEQAAAVQMLLARAYFEDEKYIIAEAEYTTFLNRFPAHPSAGEAALGVCRSYERLSPISQRDQTFTERAMQTCGNVVNDFAGTPAATEAGRVAAEMRTKLAKKVFETADWYLSRDLNDSAIIYFEALLERYPNTDWAPRALVGLMEAYTEIGYEDEVAAARERLLTRYPESPEARALANGDGSDGDGSGRGF
jgi:outer membrane protein assembly factor BamD